MKTLNPMILALTTLVATPALAGDTAEPERNYEHEIGATAEETTEMEAVAYVDVTEDGAYDEDVQWVARDEEASRELLATFADELSSGEMSLLLDERGAFLTFTDSVQFDTDSYKLDGKDKRMLRKAARVLEDHPGTRVAIMGYADEYGAVLPEMRAVRVRDFLTSKGVPEETLLPVGLGENAFVAPGEDSTANANHRVELRLLPELDPSVMGVDTMGEAG